MSVIKKKKKEEVARLTALYQSLAAESRQSLLDFADYLASKEPVSTPQRPEPIPHQRPENESVIKAIKRLSATYPMLDRAKMLNKTSSLVAEHVMQGRSATEVIDELEAVFTSHFHQVVEKYDREFGDKRGED